MKPIKNNYLNSYFPCIAGKYNWLLFFIIFYVNGHAQIHVSDNTVFFVAENTIVYVADQQTEIVIIPQKETQKQEKKIVKQHKRPKTPLQPPMMMKDTEPEKKSVLFFNARGTSPASSLFYAAGTSTIAFINTGNFTVKSFSQSKANNNSIHTFFLNDVQPIRTAFTDVYLQHQIHLENQITRPPPILIS